MYFEPTVKISYQNNFLSKRYDVPNNAVKISGFAQNTEISNEDENTYKNKSKTYINTRNHMFIES